MGVRARVLMWGLFVGAAAAALAPAGPGALIPLKMAIASADSVGNDVYVAVVVDFGNGSSMSSVSKCVPVASSAHDADALAAAVGSGNVAYANSGLLCAIDNYPANGVQNCGQSVGSGKYDYWSYWQGSTGSWMYAADGPAEQPVSTDDVEGWMFQLDEPDNRTSPPPGVAPSYSQICNPSTEVPPPTTTTSTNATAPASVTPTTAKTSAAPAPSATTGTAVSTGSKSSGATSTTTTAAAAGTTTTTLASGGSDGAGGARSQGSSDEHRSAVASASLHGSSGGGSSTNLLPVILVAVVVAALGGFALFRWRRRPAEE